ncbi:MAG: CoA pyrophosphatase [Pseudomonadota bacterium]
MLTAPARLRKRIQQSLYDLATPIADLPIAGYARPGRQRQRAAAVLIALLTEPQPNILLTVRARHLAKHPGQIAFPGGSREQGDHSVVDTALRETEEETGIQRTVIEPLGMLGRYDTITGYRMTAVVGWVEQTVEFAPDQNEVDEVFCVPLSQVTEPACFSLEMIPYQNREYPLLTLQHPVHRIWGATAALLYQMGRLLAPERAWQDDVI